MIIVDHVHTVSLFKPEAREIVFSLAAYQKKVRKNIDVIIPHAGNLNKIILRKYFDSLSEWDGYKKDMVLINIYSLIIGEFGVLVLGLSLQLSRNPHHRDYKYHYA